MPDWVPTTAGQEAGMSTRGTSEASRQSPAEVRPKDQPASAARTGPTTAMNNATGGSAASAQDVRLQQQGLPTAAQAAQNGTPAMVRQDRMQMVTADLDRARSLDSRNDNACMGAVDQARKDMAAD